MDILDLYNKPIDYKFSKEEITFIKSKELKSKYRVRYAFYKKKSSKGLYITLMYDSNPTARRRSGYLNSYETICTRDITNVEYDEIISNFGCNHRRFQVYYYKTLHDIIEAEKLYNLTIPEEYINECIKRGYNTNVQLKLF